MAWRPGSGGVGGGGVKPAPYFLIGVGPYLISEEGSKSNLGLHAPNLAKKNQKNPPSGQNGKGAEK